VIEEFTQPDLTCSML